MTSCFNTENKDSYYPTRINDTTYISKLIEKSVVEGDSLAFAEVSRYYILEEKSHDLFYVSLIMANKYDNPDAHFLLYWSIVHPIYDINRKVTDRLELLDNRSRNTALYHLLKAKELGVLNLENTVKKIFNDSIPSSDNYSFIYTPR